MSNVRLAAGQVTSGKKLKNRTYTHQDSSFLKLPGEIRNQIYTYFFANSTYNFIRRKRSSKDRTPLVVRKDKTRVKQHHLALLNGCRQTYYESSAYPFQLGQFKFISLATFAWIGDHFSPEQRARITCLQVQMWRKDTIHPPAHVKRFYKQDLENVLPGVRFMALDIILETDRTTNIKQVIEKWIKKSGRVDMIIRGIYLDSRIIVWSMRGCI
ncbi:hypothetical protein HBI38_126930 [Parastagonospora nodorum]|nr:hypothetical protein HBI09_149090 [Parastagonospora nodorum]KAH4447987.1 hypothetical protein HBH93_051280 [Parastagonospora nodorum]KAH4460259.1 hypothetical protein HBH91_070400 [Parastagonospora nodorum]KAH4497130.1 hypothetical protein HBH89_138570 [Parastagonospora nodorum]KAH4535355.1 hypothetical protein HBH85_161920 [Parastagonospora nodorum]